MTWRVTFDPPGRPPPADWTRLYWRRDPTSGSWTALLLCGRSEGTNKAPGSDSCRSLKTQVHRSTHPSFVTFDLDLDGFWYAVLCSAESFPWRESGSSKNQSGDCYLLVFDGLVALTVLPAVTQEQLLCKLQPSAFLLLSFSHLRENETFSWRNQRIKHIHSWNWVWFNLFT